LLKGRNRDTAWYALTDDGRPTIQRGLEAGLAGRLAHKPDLRTQ
jgi:hypothetical protein